MRKRKNNPQLSDRFDYMLKKKAEEGVKIYMILWDEFKMASTLNSEYSQKIFEGLHENFKIIRHPPIFPIEWAHHQKFMVIDQNIALLGIIKFKKNLI
jgi:phospholipase D1/2